MTPERMQVVMVTNNALADKFGGVERYVGDLAATLVGRGVRVRVVAKRWDDETAGRVEQSDGVIVDRYRVPGKANPLYAPLYPVYAGAGVLGRTRAGRGSGPTVVHVHMGLPGWSLAASHRPYLLTFHAPVWRELLQERQGSYRLPAPVQRTAVSSLRGVERMVAVRSSSSVVLSEFMRGELAQLDEATARRAHLIPGAVDASRFRPGPSVSAVVPTLFTARRLTPRTGVDELIRALVVIRRAVPRSRLRIAGVGALEPELRSLARSLGLGDAVDFLGRIDDDQLVREYRGADLVVLPTRELEGFGLTTAEALACGAVVVGTPVGATPELLRPLDGRLVTRDASAGAIADAVVALLQDPDGRAALRARARSRIVPGMTWDAVADRYVQLYERIAHDS